MNLLRRAILTLACLAAALASAAEYSIKSWDNNDGLPSSSILAIAQTSDGYLWLGTLRGLVRFDGLIFKVYDPANTPTLTDARILTLFADSSGGLWIGTESGGIVTMRDGVFTAPKELADRRLVSACEEAPGIVWLLNANGELWRHDSQRFTPLFVDPNNPGIGAPRTLIKERSGPLWVGSEHRQAAVDTTAIGSGLEPPVTQTFAARNLNQLVASATGGYWRFADGQVQHWTGKKLDSSEIYRWGAGGVLMPACEDVDQSVVVGTQGAGLFRYYRDGRPYSTISTNDGLSSNWLLSLLVDREGTLWIGTDGGGLNRVTRQAFKIVPETRNWVVQSVAPVTNQVWIAGFGRPNGITTWSNGVFRPIEGTPWFIKSIFVDRDQRVWAGTPEQGLLVSEGRGFVQAPAAQVQSIFQDKSGRLWFGSQQGLHRFNGSEWKMFNTADGLSSDAITAIAEDSKGVIWVGTARAGLNKLNGERFEPVSREGGAPLDISALLVDREGIIWVSTAAYGLFRYANESWTRYSDREGLISNSLGYLLESPDDDALWIGSNRGVLRVWKRQLNEVAAGRRNFVQCRAYSTPEGLPHPECTSGSQPGAARDSQGRLWFPTVRGIAWVDPSQLTPNTNAPPVSIETIWVDHDPVNPGRALTLSPASERLEIQYTSLNFRAPEKALFRYLLEGHENDWTEAGNVRVARYSRLPPGHYTFRVTACNEDGVWNERGSELAIVVQPPIWRTWWFITIVTLGAIGAIAGAVHLVSRQRYERQLAVMRQQEALEKERARIARDIHDQVGASLTQVALLGELLEVDKGSPPDVESHAQQITQTARETTRALDEIVWTVNPSNDTLEGLVNYICKYTQDYLGVAGIKYRLDVPAQVPAFDIAPDARHNVFLAAKEAITNIVRHSQATSAWLRIRISEASFTIEIEDNGKGLAGMDTARAKTRHGLSNMRSRVEEIGGSFSLENGAEGGALARLTVPLKGQNVA